ncbi:hypothetical protein HDU92_000828 [Lobulomyces angularis]|nr:hypothetical protein HDU92_000828 [Lobulomyces angularis]
MAKDIKPELRQRNATSSNNYSSSVTNDSKTNFNENKLAQVGKTWGRARDVSFADILPPFFIMLLCPYLVIYFWTSCTHYDCSITTPILLLSEKGFTIDTIADFIFENFPKPTVEGFLLYFGWLFFQGFLYSFLPGKIGFGQTTPAGHTLPYIVNGTLAWIVTHGLFVALSLGLKLFPASIIHDNWGGLLIAANVQGYLLSFFSYWKAHFYPTFADDRKFSGSWIYDIFWGIEFNPRFGKYFDFKLFFNGRPGIVAWTLINFSFAAAQYNNIGYVTNSMILLNWLHFLYVIDFFINEDWYLRTIDIAHDHFGFYLSWGDCVWLPFMYTLQSHYLVRNPIDLSWEYFSLVFFIGHFGYYVFRATNWQKDVVRRTNGDCLIWGKKAKVIRTKFETSDGKIHESLLLLSGFWGVSRHFNYVGDLLISLAMCLTCGFAHLLPYFYVIYMTILLVARINRDHHRCLGKYGKYWEEYCRAVPYKLIPFVF